MWTALSKMGQKPGKRLFWFCKCSCGTEREVLEINLVRGATKGCGCVRVGIFTKIITKHGLRYSVEYAVWSTMKDRCLNPRNKQFKHYGGRGVKVCERWMQFENFISDMGKRPKGLSLDRINNDGNYEPPNCRWATIREQSRNKRSNKVLIFNGKKMCVRDWDRHCGFKDSTIRNRIKLGWTGEKLFKPVQIRKMKIEFSKEFSAQRI